MDNDLFDQPRKKSLVDALGGGGLMADPGAMPDRGMAPPPIDQAEPGGFTGGANLGGPSLAEVANGAPGLAQQGASGALAGLGESAPKPAAPSADYGRLMGYDSGKLNDPNKHDFKYDTARTLAQFDPRQGFTPDVINALNKLDYGTFSGSGDKLSLTGAKNAKDAANFDAQDWIYAHKANNADTKWNFGGGGAADRGVLVESPQQGGGMFSNSTISPMLQGNAQNGIQSALSNIGGLADSSRIEELIKQLGGGQ